MTQGRPVLGRQHAPVETARYVAEFTAELTYLAQGAQLDLLAYLLDMARLEAIRTAQSRWGKTLRADREQRDGIAAVAFEPADNLKLQQSRLDDPDGKPRLPDEIVDGDG